MVSTWREKEWKDYLSPKWKLRRKGKWFKERKVRHERGKESGWRRGEKIKVKKENERVLGGKGKG